MTIYFTKSCFAWIRVCIGALFRIFHRTFYGFDMKNAELIQNINQTYPSIFMRVFMLADILSKQKNMQYCISATNKDAIKNSIVVVSKHIANNKHIIKLLKRNRNIIISDTIEIMLDPNTIQYYDGMMCCSHKAMHYLKQNHPDAPVYFVQHGIDPRIQTVRPPIEHFSPYYFGSPENILLFESIKPLVHIIYTNDDRGRINHNWHLHLSDANFHYAVRPLMQRKKYKPFVKGFTAAACNANILIHADDGDALHYLGEDYPYLIKEELCEEVVLRYMRQAHADFGTERWRYGLEKMSRLRACCGAQVIVEQFMNMIQQVVVNKGPGHTGSRYRH